MNACLLGHAICTMYIQNPLETHWLCNSCRVLPIYKAEIITVFGVNSFGLLLCAILLVDVM